MNLRISFSTCFCIFFSLFFFQISESLNEVYVSGSNTLGQLGLTNVLNELQFTESVSLETAIQIASCSNHVLVLFENTSVAVFGQNNDGQLGLGDYEDRDVPTLLPNVNNVKSVHAGYYFSMIILNDNSVYVFGDNAFGQLGLGLNVHGIPTPTLNPSLNGNQIQELALSNHTLVLLTNGSVLSFGSNSYGQLGQGNFNPYYTPTLIPNLNNVIDIAVGIYHSVFLLNNGTIFACGNDDRGQLGFVTSQNINTPVMNPFLSSVTKIDCGEYFCYTLLANTSVFSWGYNYYGALGLGFTGNQSVPSLVPGMSNVTDFSMGFDHVFLLLANGTIVGTGRNTLGELGIPEISVVSTFTQIPILNNLNNIQFNKTHFLAAASYFIQYTPGGKINNSNSLNLIVIVVPIAVFVLLLCVFLVILFAYLKRRNSLEIDEELNENITINENEFIGESNRIYKGSYTGKVVVLKKIMDNNLNELNFYEKIGRNPNVVEFFGLYENKGEQYIVLELLNSSFSQYLTLNKKLAIENLLKFIHQISICLSYLEEREYIHGNICCENILRKENNKLKLCDFELSHSIYHPLILSEKDLSRIQFCAPEVKKNKKYDKKSDVWSWSVTCIQIFYLNQENNDQPFQLNEQILSSKPPQCPDDLWNIIQKGLNADPNLRPSFKEIEKDAKIIYQVLKGSRIERLLSKSQNSQNYE